MDENRAEKRSVALNMGTKKLKVISLVSMMLLGCSVEAFADAGVPMLMLAWPGMIALLVPVILIEVFVSKLLLKKPFGKTVGFISASNAISTVIGIPLTWLVLVVFQMVTGGGGGGYGISTPIGRILSVTWQAAWLLPIDDELYWMVPTAMFVLLIPFFFASWWVEYRVCHFMLRNVEFDERILRRSVFWANIFSYIFLALVDIGYFVFSVSKHTGG